MRNFVWKLVEAPIPTPKSTITFMKGQTKSQKRPKNTYGRSSGSMKRRKIKINRPDKIAVVIKNVGIVDDTKVILVPPS